MFSLFPGGSAGRALLLLRLCNALLCAVALKYLPDVPTWLVVVVLVVATFQIVGLLTPFTAIVCAIAATAAGVRLGGALGSVVALHALSAIALATLGAGAYSVDARLFGRRVISLDR